MKKQQGFTLIELIIVIVILGILAVTAAPRFIDLQGDARAAALDGVAAALQGGSQLVYAKAAIGGDQATEGATIDLDNDGAAEVTTDFGYPDADAQTLTSLDSWVELDLTDDDTATGFDFLLTIGSGDADTPAAGSFAITPLGTEFSNTASEQCQVVYTNAASAGGSPTIDPQTDGC